MSLLCMNLLCEELQAYIGEVTIMRCLDDTNRMRDATKHRKTASAMLL